MRSTKKIYTTSRESFLRRSPGRRRTILQTFCKDTSFSRHSHKNFATERIVSELNPTVKRRNPSPIFKDRYFMASFSNFLHTSGRFEFTVYVYALFS